MPRLPQVGSDDGSWGQILNDFLTVEHNTDGTLKQASTISQAASDASTALTTVNSKYTKPPSGIPKTDLSTTVQTSLDLADTTATTAIKTIVAGTNLTVDNTDPINPVVNATTTPIPDATTTTKGIIQLSGDLAGTATSPSVTKINGVAVSGVPTVGQGLVATSGSTAAWNTLADPSGQFPVNTVASSGATVTLPTTYAAHVVVLSADCILTFTSPSVGHAFLLQLSGAYIPTFPVSVKWAGGIIPSYVNTGTLYQFVTLDGGTTWQGTGQAHS